MLCKNPYRKGVLEFGCGQCVPCRINRARQWVGRMLLESYEHPASCFITLTYNEPSLPFGETVRKRDVQLFLKRLRLKCQDPVFYRKVRVATIAREIRYYVCSEYGDENGRPHYHGILFGVSPLELEIIQAAWSKGIVDVGTAELKSMSYVSGYLVKLGTQEGDLLRGTRVREFQLMSRKPGLGIGIVERMKKAYGTPQGQAALSKGGTLASTFKTDGGQYPIGRYLHSKCTDQLGIRQMESSNRLHALIAKKTDENSGKSGKQIRLERTARYDQEGFKRQPKRRKL